MVIKLADTMWFLKAIFPKYCVKMLANTQSIHCAVALYFKKISP